MNMRTPLKNVRHLGSAKEGADHFWMQRVTAVANLVLGLFLVWLIASLAGADYATVKSTLADADRIGGDPYAARDAGHHRGLHHPWKHENRPTASQQFLCDPRRGGERMGNSEA